jgi:hypothetical protein
MARGAANGNATARGALASLGQSESRLDGQRQMARRMQRAMNHAQFVRSIGIYTAFGRSDHLLRKRGSVEREPTGWCRRRVAAVVVVLATCWTPGVTAQDVGAQMDESEFRDWVAQFAGVYEFPSGRHVVIVPHTSA